MISILSSFLLIDEGPVYESPSNYKPDRGYFSQTGLISRPADESSKPGFPSFNLFSVQVFKDLFHRQRRIADVSRAPYISETGSDRFIKKRTACGISFEGLFSQYLVVKNKLKS
jgi:hypothetical protein